MEPLSLDLSGLPKDALLLLDSAPIIYFLEAHPQYAARFAPIFERHNAGELHFAITPITIAEVLTGPLQSGDEALTRRFRAIFESWRCIDITGDIAEAAARLRSSLRLRLPDAFQAACALAINAAALVTHDRDFSRIKALRIIC